ncbi:MAG: response regulator [Candidatus Peribacteraceae bacterium]|nr:response regulator [Candidatus Peribacteraceae bacterium]
MTTQSTPNQANAPVSILIAEDDTSLLEIMSMQLEKIGYEVRQSTNGKAAVKAIENNKPDILLLDLLMPEMDGFEVLEYLKKKDIHLPIIVLTNLGQEQNSEKTLQLGATECFVKSDTPLSVLGQKIERIVAKNRKQKE